MNKQFWRATLIRCARTFLTTILASWTGGQLITTVDWKLVLLTSVSATAYIFVLCLLAGLPEVDTPEELTDEELLEAHAVEMGDMDEEAK